MGPTWVLSAPDGPHVGPMNLAIRATYERLHSSGNYTIIHTNSGTGSIPYICLGSGIAGDNTLRLGQDGHQILDVIFKCVFFNKNIVIFWNFTEICSQGANLQHASIGSNYSLVLNRHRAIIWTNNGLVYWHIYPSPGLRDVIGVTYLTSSYIG